MAKITINDKEFEVEDGKNLVDAAAECGVDIPHYCYHPGLSIAGQCRMCLCEQEGNPKLQIACNMKATEGLSVKTNTKRVEDAVKWGLEFHLINHPIDCPICDQAGECGLQEYYMEHGKYRSQMREEKVHKEKVVSLGDKVMLDKERCILCSRCVRFTEEISKTADLGIFNRGDRSVIGTVNDKPMKGNYQLNTVDICPVGALTSQDFRFEQRVWFLKESESVCGGCSKGCNVYVHHKDGKHIYRLKPRYNAEVNEYWMCDVGRLTYKEANYDKRLTAARLGGVELPLHEAIQTWATDLRTLVATERTEEVGVWITPHETNEELTAIFKKLKDKFNISKFFSENVQALIDQDEYVDDLLYRKDPYPNSKGFLSTAQNSGIKLQSVNELYEQLSRGSLTHLILFVPEGERALEVLNQIAGNVGPDCFVSILTPQAPASEVFPNALCLPSLSHFEKTGTIINHAGIAQHLSADFKMFKESESIDGLLRMLVEAHDRPKDATARERKETA